MLANNNRSSSTTSDTYTAPSSSLNDSLPPARAIAEGSKLSSWNNTWLPSPTAIANTRCRSPVTVDTPDTIPSVVEARATVSRRSPLSDSPDCTCVPAAASTTKPSPCLAATPTDTGAPCGTNRSSTADSAPGADPTSPASSGNVEVCPPNNDDTTTAASDARSSSRRCS